MSQAAPGSGRLIAFLLLGGIVLGGLVLYTLQHHRPLVPADADHLPARDQAECLRCHGPGARNARGPNHPLNDQCFSCHERS